MERWEEGHEPGDAEAGGDKETGFSPGGSRGSQPYRAFHSFSLWTPELCNNQFVATGSQVVDHPVIAATGDEYRLCGVWE